MFSSAHRRDCEWRQQVRRDKIDSLDVSYSAPLTDYDTKLHGLSLAELVRACTEGQLVISDIVLVYGKKVLAAQDATNCITEFMFDEALALSAKAKHKTLLGVPISIKDCIDVEGYDTTIGYSRNLNRPAIRSAAIVRMLRDAGALLHVKTTNPTGLFGLETFSDIFGYTSNPYNADFTTGASTGGGAALLAYGGSKVEIGSDIGGSVRIPAHWCSVYGMKSCVGRFPSDGCVSSVPGLEGLPIVTSPMAGELEDLEEFWERIIDMKPWEYDHSCVPLPWRKVDLAGKRLKFGVLWDDGIVPPSPACKRALQMVVDALRREGHEVVDFTPPPILDLLKLGFPITFSDGGVQLVAPLRRTEAIEPAVRGTHAVFSLPRVVKRLLAWFTRQVVGDTVGAALLSVLNPCTVLQERELIVQRDACRQQWHEKWNQEGLDFVLTVPHSLPAIPRGTANTATLNSSAYCFMWNFLDYTAGVLPITHVDKEVDALPPSFSTKGMTTAAQGAYSLYDVEKMHGLPLGVQVVGRRLEEEKVLKGMGVVKDAMQAVGNAFVRKQL